MGLYVGPLGIGEVSLVCFSHARYSTESLSQKPFSDGFGRGILGSSDTGPCIDRPSSAARMASKALRAGQPTPLEMMGMRITMRVLDSSGIHRLLFS
jgi:hypothetical protein